MSVCVYIYIYTYDTCCIVLYYTISYHIMLFTII